MRQKLLKLFMPKKQDVNKKKSLISSLAPKVLVNKEDIEKVQPYLDKLSETIETKGINNIALTGGYGSGKSTIIGTFKELNPQYHFLNISLASFNKKESDDSLTQAEKKIQKEELERLLEVSILQQIFYHVKPEKIPESRFKRIINIPNWKIWNISIGFILWVSSSILLLKYDYLDKINPNSWNSRYNLDWFTLFIFLIAFLGLGLFSKLFVKLFSNSKINKVNIKGELELGDNANKSVFNEHLEEILYFFERTEYDVVIIEDLDRFDSTDIFTKLREINILLNNAIPIGREINFVYAVGDDLFEDKKERVKFFEYIIPVIPFINSSNADEQLRTLIKEAGLDESIFTKEFISDITTFIDDIDMRLLTNIFHEFVIYRNTLKPEFIKKGDELFAVITYKNVDPKDFTKLNKKEGKLYELINNKKTYIQKFTSNIDTEIAFVSSQIVDIEKYTIADINELNCIYFQKILLALPQNALVNKTIIANDIETIIESKNLGYKYLQSGYLYDENFVFNFSEIENKVDPNYTYKERVEIIKSKNNNKISILKNDLERLKSKKYEIENWDLKQIFNEIDITEYLNVFSNNGLLRNLILNGYINENYNDYISLFHAVSITKEDFSFERNVKGGYATEFDYKLSDKIENLVEKIDLRYFEKEAILNFDLLDYLGNNYSRYTDKYDSIIRLLSNEREKSIKFIDEYIKNQNRPIAIFIETLVGNWKGFWQYIYSKSNFTDESKNRYLELIIRFSSIENILENQSYTLLKKGIEENSNFLSLMRNANALQYFDKIPKILNELEIEFEKLDPPNEETNQLFNLVFENNFYKINRENLLQMYFHFGNDSSEAEFNNSNYSAILKSDCQPMIDYVNSHVNKYIDEVYLKLENNKLEEESNLIKLLNDKGLTAKSKAKIIEKVETKISNLKNINELEVKTLLLINNKIIPEWNNVIDYFIASENIIDENLIYFLEFENVNEELSKNKLGKDNGVFEENFLLCNDISDETYIKMLESIYFAYNKLAFENLNEDKVIELANRILTTTQSNYDLLRKKFRDNHIRLIERDFKKFIEKERDFERIEDDDLIILKSEKISIDNKYSYIPYVDENAVSDNKEISIEVSNIILQKSLKIEFELNTIESLVRNTVSSQNKVRLINLYINDIDDSSLIALLKGINGYDKLFDKGKPTFIKSDPNRILFERLKAKNLIKNYYDDKWNDENYRITTNY